MAKRGENIYHRKDGRWEGRYILGRKEDGRYKYGYIYGKNYLETKKELMNRKNDLDLPSDVLNWKTEREALLAAEEMAMKQAESSGPILFRYPVEGWLAASQRRVRESTYTKYWNVVHSYILPELGEIEWENLNWETIDLFCHRLIASGGKKQQGLSPETVADTLSVIRNIFRYATSRGYEKPCDISSITIKREIKDMRILSRREQETLCDHLLTHLNDRNLGILLCLFTGLRLGEICALRWEDVSFSEQALYVHQTMQRLQNRGKTGKKTRVIITPPKSRSSIRRIPVPDELADILFVYGKEKTGYVLTGKEEAFVEPRTMERYFARILKEAELEKVNFHALRHTFATRCVEMSFDLKSLSEILGHTNVNITLNRYVHPSMDLKRRNMQRLAALLAVS